MLIMYFVTAFFLGYFWGSLVSVFKRIFNLL